MGKRQIGFRSQEEEEEEVGCIEENVEAIGDLHDELVKIVNTLISLIGHYNGTIKGIIVTADTSGKHSTKIEF